MLFQIIFFFQKTNFTKINDFYEAKIMLTFLAKNEDFFQKIK